MRAADLNERNNPSAVLYYAPRRRAAADGSTIGPILERLSRGDRRARTLVEEVPLAPLDEPIGAPDVAAVRARALAIAARFVAVTGVGVGAAVALAFALQDPQRSDRAPLAMALLANPVQTVSYKLQARMTDDAARLAPAQSEPLHAAANEIVAGPQEAGDAPLPAALASYAMAPPALPPARWSVPEQISHDIIVPDVAPEHADHAAAPAHHHHARIHRHRHAAAAQPQQADNAPQEKADAAPPPVDNSLSSVLHKMFKPD